MPDPEMTFFARLIVAAKWTGRVIRRIAIALLVFGRALYDAEYARAFNRGASGAKPPRQAAPTATLGDAPPDSALLLLGLLQKEGRLIDFLKQNVAEYSDEQVGAATRVVHQGCRRVLDGYLTITPVRAESEGARVLVEPGFDQVAVRLTGQVVGEPPFHGTLVHGGWRATDLRFPQVPSGRDLSILAAAEVEL
ncbi:MAG TPA: DUF2760 domain-containing protein [Lamprocystis sp. (in: g-proteobacteria)]|nr:DUF2760 domain-containing protein [Lamprocystis sp. (in: g-proteobacteria)]